MIRLVYRDFPHRHRFLNHTRPKPTKMCKSTDAAYTSTCVADIFPINETSYVSNYDLHEHLKKNGF